MCGGEQERGVGRGNASFLPRLIFMKFFNFLNRHLFILQLPVVDRGEVLFNNTESFVESSASATESRLGDPDPANCSPDIYSSSISRGILPGASTSEQPRMYNLKRRYKRKKWGPLRGRARNSRSASSASFRPRSFNAIPHNEVKTPKETLDPDWTKKELVVTDVTTDSFMVTFIECEDADTLFGVPE